MAQSCPYPLALPTILDERRVLGSFVAWCAGIAYDGDDLLWVLGMQSDQAEVIHAISASEVAGLLVRYIFHRTQEAQIDGAFAASSVEPLQGGSIVWPNDAKGDLDSAKSGMRLVFVHADYPISLVSLWPKKGCSRDFGCRGFAEVLQDEERGATLEKVSAGA